VRVLTDGESSLSLCLYGFIGLGALRWAHWMKRSSLAWVPDWYHSGGPFQIGHSHAAGPDLRFTPVPCFVQPQCEAQDDPLRYDRGTLTPFLRESQFATTLLASRGPPA